MPAATISRRNVSDPEQDILHLAFYLKAYGKEEYGHEGVVDELEHGHWLSVVAEHVESASTERNQSVKHYKNRSCNKIRFLFFLFMTNDETNRQTTPEIDNYPHRV